MLHVPSRISIGVALFSLLCMPRPAAAQDATTRSVPKWEIDVHGGGIKDYNPAAGTASLPGPGATFATLIGLPSRRVSSWYFGDGSQLFNQAGAAFRLGQTMTPLDPALRATVARQGNALFGVRAGRALTSRLSAEFNVDYNRGSLVIGPDALAAIEASRSSFISAWKGLIATGPFMAPVITSTSDVRDRQGGQLFTVGTARVNLTTRGRVTPFLTAGAGLITNLGDAPRATLTGKYQFSILGLWPVTETDVVTVRYVVPRREVAGVFGGGFTYAASPRSGLRVDVRTDLKENRSTTLVSANPAVQSQSPVGGIASFTTPSVQFVNSPALLRTESTLSGPPIDSFESFKGTGWARHVNMTAGWYWRF